MSNLKDAWIELKNHVVRNKERYIVGAVVVTVGNTTRSSYNFSPSALSSHLNKGMDLTRGLHFERLGVLS